LGKTIVHVSDILFAMLSCFYYDNSLNCVQFLFCDVCVIP